MQRALARQKCRRDQRDQTTKSLLRAFGQKQAKQHRTAAQCRFCQQALKSVALVRSVAAPFALRRKFARKHGNHPRRPGHDDPRRFKCSRSMAIRPNPVKQFIWQRCKSLEKPSHGILEPLQKRSGAAPYFRAAASGRPPFAGSLQSDRTTCSFEIALRLAMDHHQAL